MASLGLMIVFGMLAWSGCTVEGLPVTVAPTDNMSPYITTEEANKVILEDFTDLLYWVTSNKDTACNSLEHHCNSLTASDLPAGVTCEEYAESLGTGEDMGCTRPITTPDIHDGIDRSLETTVQELIESTAGHKAMLKGLLALPSYTSSQSCSSVTATSPEYFICRLKKHVRISNRTDSVLQYLLSDLESDNLSGSVSCEAPPSAPKTAPLGVLWKIRKDNDIHQKNVRAICEHIKVLQNNSEHICL